MEAFELQQKIEEEGQLEWEEIREYDNYDSVEVVKIERWRLEKIIRDYFNNHLVIQCELKQGGKINAKI